MKNKTSAAIFSLFIILCSETAFAKKPNILVTPFQNRGNSRYSWLSQGMSDTLISDLALIKGISVISEEDRINVIREMELEQAGILKDTVAVNIGRAAGADLVFTGGYRVLPGGEITVKAKIIEVNKKKVRKSVTLRGTLKEIFKLQDKIVPALLAESEKIAVKGAPASVIKNEELRRIRKKYRPAFTAYEWYCRGLEARYTEPEKAVTFFKKALAIDRNYTDALIKAGYVSGRALSRFSEAAGFLKRAELLLKKAGLGMSPESAYLHMVSGIVYSNSGDHKRAGKHYLKSKSLYEKLNFKEHRSYAVLLINTGQHYEYIGDMDEALDSYFMAKDLLERQGLDRSSNYSALLNNIGIVFNRKGRYKRALEFFNRSKKLKEKLNLANSRKYSLTINNMGLSFFYMGNLKKALKLYIRAKKLRERLGLAGTKEYASILMNIGNIYGREKKYDRSIILLKKSEKILKKLNLANTKTYSTVLMNLGTSYRSLKQRKKGLAYYMKSKKLKENLNLINTAGYGNLMLNMGVTYHNMKNRKTACRYFELAYRAYKRAGYKGRLKKTAKSFSRQCKKNRR